MAAKVKQMHTEACFPIQSVEAKTVASMASDFGGSTQSSCICHKVCSCRRTVTRQSPLTRFRNTCQGISSGALCPPPLGPLHLLLLRGDHTSLPQFWTAVVKKVESGGSAPRLPSFGEQQEQSAVRLAQGSAQASELRIGGPHRKQGWFARSTMWLPLMPFPVLVLVCRV